MEIDPKNGTVTLHKSQQKLLREAMNLVNVLAKLNPDVTDLQEAIDVYCDKVEASK